MTSDFDPLKVVLVLSVILVGASLGLSTTLAEEHPDLFEPQPTANSTVFLTSDHRGGLEIYTDNWTENGTIYDSKFKPYAELKVWLIGENLSYKLLVNGELESNGTTNQTVQSYLLNISNYTTLSLIVIIDNQTHNFGSMFVSKVPLVLDDAPDDVLVIDAEDVARLVYRNRMGIAFSSIATIAVTFIFVVILKRGRVKTL